MTPRCCWCSLCALLYMYGTVRWCVLVDGQSRLVLDDEKNANHILSSLRIELQTSYLGWLCARSLNHVARHLGLLHAIITPPFDSSVCASYLITKNKCVCVCIYSRCYFTRFALTCRGVRVVFGMGRLCVFAHQHIRVSSRKENSLTYRWW